MVNRIGWCESTWSPMTGCSKVSEACRSCWAERMSWRLAGRFGYPIVESFRPTFHPDRLDIPLHWRKPRRIFVCSMSDLFHEAFTWEQVVNVLTTVALCPQHTFIVLTKRPGRARLILSDKGVPSYVDLAVHNAFPLSILPSPWPLPNLHLGVTVENQARADERIPILLDTPAAVRFVCCEPLLSDVDLSRYLTGGTVNDTSRGFVSSGIGTGDILNRHERSGVASQEACGGQSCRHSVLTHVGQSAQSRDNADEGPSARAVHDGGWSDVGLRAPSGVDGCQPSRDSERLGDQPQGWGPDEQQTGEPRFGNQTREHTSRRTGAEAPRNEGSERRDERSGKGDRVGRDTHQGIVGGANDDAAADRRGVRPQTASGELHSDSQKLVSCEVGLDWVIAGGENGPGARSMQPEWALDLWRQCKATGVPFWFKGWGATGDPFLLPGGDRYSKDDYADMLRMEPTRELPAVVS